MIRLVLIFYVLIFISCKQTSINENIISNDLQEALEQAVLVGENNNLNFKNISVVFTDKDLHVFVSNAPNECYSSPYEYIDAKINNKNYRLIFDQSTSILSKYIDVNQIRKVDDLKPKDECEINGFAIVFRYDKTKKKYILGEVINNENYELEFLNTEELNAKK